MGSDTTPPVGPVLAFDTSAAHCAVALRVGGATATRADGMARGQADALMPMMHAVLSEKGLGIQDLWRIGVGIGPGNFTGIRIAISAARGLALGLAVPALGVSGFDALRHGISARVAAIPAPRATAYVQHGTAPPEQIDLAEVPAEAVWPGDPEDHVRAIAEITATAAHVSSAPSPLYIRPPDAVPAADPGPVIFDDT